MVGIAPSMNPIMKLNAILPSSSSIGFPFNSGTAINRTFVSFQEVRSSYSENWLRFRQFSQHSEHLGLVRFHAGLVKRVDLQQTAGEITREGEEIK
jgi:hypothetical protein